MEDNSEFNKRNGIFYTPVKLADYLVEPLIEKSNKHIFDPSYGNGSLLLAVERNFRKKFKRNIKGLFGCDIHPVNGLVTHLPKANLKQQDFFKYPLSKKFDVVVSNPPFVKHQKLDKKKFISLKKEIPELKVLSNSSDLWAYFLIKSVLHLNPGGSIGAILPWSLLQSDYSVNIRSWVLDKFQKIKVLALNQTYFENIEERIVFLWMENYGENTKSISLSFSNTFESKLKYSKLSKRMWKSPKLNNIKSSNLIMLNEKLRECGFKKFNIYADTKIGIVTGANKFFIREKDELKKLGFRKSEMTNILTSSKELPMLTHDEVDCKVLMKINSKTALRFKELLSEGESLGYHLRSHSKNRPYWFAINQGEVPDAFFPYRINQIPFLILNKQKIQSTNSIHRVYFKNLSEVEQKWIAVCLLSIYSQLFMEINSKTYGREMLKIEPGGLGNVLVVTKKSKRVNEVYEEVLSLVANQRKNLAVIKATRFISNEFSIPTKIENLVRGSLEKIQASKKGKSKDENMLDIKK